MLLLAKRTLFALLRLLSTLLGLSGLLRLEDEQDVQVMNLTIYICESLEGLGLSLRDELVSLLNDLLLHSVLDHSLIQVHSVLVGLLLRLECLVCHVLRDGDGVDFDLHLALAFLRNDEELLKHLVKDEDDVLECQVARILTTKQVNSRHLRGDTDLRGVSKQDDFHEDHVLLQVHRDYCLVVLHVSIEVASHEEHLSV